MPDAPNRFRMLLDGTEYTVPENWKQFTPVTKRHSVYRSLLTQFSEGGVVLIKDAKDYVDGVYANYGAGQTITMSWQEYDIDTQSYSDVFDLGKIDLAQKYQRSRDRTEVGFEPTDFVMQMLNRDEVQMNLQELTDMDGDAVTPFTDETIDVSFDHVEVILNSSMTGEDEDGDWQYQVVSGFDSTHLYGGISFNVFSKDEVPFRNEVTMVATEDRPEPLYVMKYAGISVINWTVWILFSNAAHPSPPTVRMQINDDAEITGTATLEGTSGSTTVYSYTYSDTLALDRGDEIRLYIKSLSSGSGSITIVSDGGEVPIGGISTAECDFSIDQTSESVASDVTGMLVWEYLLRICQKITGRADCLRSAFFGRTDGEQYQYSKDGRGSGLFISNVQLLRGKSLSDNPINSSLRQAFNELNSLYCLYLGVVYESGVPYIEIGQIGEAFDSSSVIATFTPEDPGIKWRSAIKYTWGNVKSGFKNHQLNDTPTTESAHSKRSYSVPFLSKQINNSYTAENDWIASSQLIELLRREKDLTKDTDFDEKMVVVTVKRNGPNWDRRKRSEFPTVTGYADTLNQYNLDLLPARNIARHAPLLLAAQFKRMNFIPSFDEYLRFESGEGENLDVTTFNPFEMNGIIDEGDDIAISDVAGRYSIPLFHASEMGTCTVKLTRAQRQAIKEGAKGAINIVEDGVTKLAFIEEIKQTDLQDGTAKLVILDATGALTDLYILEETGDVMLEETGNRMLEERSQ